MQANARIQKKEATKLALSCSPSNMHAGKDEMREKRREEKKGEKRVRELEFTFNFLSDITSSLTALVLTTPALTRASREWVREKRAGGVRRKNVFLFLA